MRCLLRNLHQGFPFSTLVLSTDEKTETGLRWPPYPFTLPFKRTMLTAVCAKLEFLKFITLQPSQVMTP